MNVKHFDALGDTGARISTAADALKEQDCPLCAFMEGMSLGEARERWGMQHAAAFLLALRGLDRAQREADYGAEYASEWLHAFVDLLGVAPREFLDGIPASWLAGFLGAGAEALADLDPEASARGRSAAEALERGEARA